MLQVVQLFDSWAHHLSPEQSAEFSMPYAERIIAAVRAKYPHVPLIFHANGGSGKHAALAQCSAGASRRGAAGWRRGCGAAGPPKAIALSCSLCCLAWAGSFQPQPLALLLPPPTPAQPAADVIGLDWECSMAAARSAIGAGRTLQGNVDPMVLFGTEAAIRDAVTRCLVEAGPAHHILNVGHGVIEGTPEESVGLFCDLARQSADILAAHGKAPAAAKQPVAV